jgi:hypothetical protein
MSSPMRIAKILLLTGVCGCANAADPFDAPAPPTTLSNANNRTPVEAFDRRQSAYVVTSVESRAGAKFRSGSAQLSILQLEGRPTFVLELTTAREGEELAVWMAMGSSPPNGTTLSFAQDPASPLAFTVRRTDSVNEEPTTFVKGSAQLSLEQSGRARPRIVGSIDTGDTSTSLKISAEYELTCWVPTEGSEPADAELHDDSEFTSTFCSQFAALR